MHAIECGFAHQIFHDGLTIEGYSRAAVQTCWRIPELDVGFDLGWHPYHFSATSNWFVSHCHLDHIAALPLFVSHRRRKKLSPPRIAIPKRHASDVRKLLATCQQLERRELPCNVIELEDGDEVDLSPTSFVTPFATPHTVPSMGFFVWNRQPAMPAPSAANATAADVKNVPLVCYTGDMSPDGLDKNPAVFQAKVLIIEMTFVDPRHRRDLIRKHGHLHLDDFALRAERFENELIIASHVTARSSPQQVSRCIRRSLPRSLQERLIVWM